MDRIYLYHIRKTGGTSITNGILSLYTDDPSVIERRLGSRQPRVVRAGDLVVAAHDRLALQAGWYTYGWSHIPAWRLRLRPRTYTVTVLRDPIDRVVSLYRYLSDPGSDHGHIFGAPLAERAIAAEGFDRFLDLVPKSDLLNQLYMFSARFDPAEAAERIERCSLVFLVQDMSHGLAKLSALIGRRLPERAERRSSGRFAPSDEQLERLRRSLAPEYALMDRLRPRLQRAHAG